MFGGEKHEVFHEVFIDCMVDADSGIPVRECPGERVSDDGEGRSKGD
jgi:hypothetical protein